MPPTASASANPTSGTAPLTVSFTGSGSDSDGTIVSYSWSFGDGGTSTSQNPAYTYNSAGNYTATLTVTDDDGATGNDSVNISVSNDETEPFIQSSSINGNIIDITFSESVLNATEKDNYNFDPELVIDTITVDGDTYRLHMTTSIPSYTIIQVKHSTIKDAAENPFDTDYINDDDDDGMADDWEAWYGVDDPDGNPDDDGWTNYQEYMDGTEPNNAGSEPDYPEIVEVIPHDGAGIAPDDTRVPCDTSFLVRIKDDGGINCNDTLAKDPQGTSIKFTINDGVNPAYDVTLDNSSIFKRKKLTDAPNTAETELWAAYHRSKDGFGNYEYGAEITIQVTVKDRAGIETHASYSFEIESKAQHDEAQDPVNLPDTDPVDPSYLGEDYVDPNDPAVTGTYDAGILVTSGDLRGAKILYDFVNDVDVTPRFGPLGEIPGLDLAGVVPMGDAPMNLQPPTMFTIPARIFIPYLGYTDVSGLSIYLYKYNEGTGYMEWVLACNANGNVQPGGEGWMVPGSRVNHNDTDPPTIEIQVYHFSGAQPGDGGDNDGVDNGGGSGGGGGGCFIATAAFGSAFEKHVKVLNEFKDVYLLSNRLGLAFVDAYERFSPPAARFIANHDSLRAVVRVALLPVVGASWMALHAGPWVTLVLMVLLLLGLMGLVVKGFFLSQRSQRH